jgi:Fur family transcriptional regulator, peroxide stress response regulator
MEDPEKKSRNTRQRGVILEILKESCAHPTAEAVYHQARKSLPNISLGTVYRNLNVLRDQGLAREIRPAGSSSSRFDGNCLPHAHFYCTECRTMIDLPLPASLQENVRDGEEVGSVSAMDLQMIGTCARCAPPVPQLL